MRSAAFLFIFLVFGAISFLLFGSLLESIQPGIVFHTGQPGPDEMSRLTLFVLFIMALSYACSEAMVSRLMGPPPGGRRNRIRNYEDSDGRDADLSREDGGFLRRFRSRKPAAGAGKQDRAHSKRKRGSTRPRNQPESPGAPSPGPKAGEERLETRAKFEKSRPGSGRRRPPEKRRTRGSRDLPRSSFPI